MKIAIVSNTSFNIYNFRLGLILFLQSKGYEVIYIAPFDEYVEKISLKTNARFFPLKHMARKGYNPFADMLLVKELHNIYKKESVDFALTYTIKPNIYGTLATLFIKTKAIANITGLGYVFLKKSIGNTIAKWLFKISLKFASAVVFQNESDRTLFEEGGLVDHKKTRLINGSGINAEVYKPNDKNANPASFTFLFVGRLLFDKGIREFVAAANRWNNEIEPATFHIVGAMDEGNPSAVSPEELDQWLLQNVHLKFFNHQTNVIPFIQDCNVVVLPSYREGIPRVLLEAMCLEKPFITTDSPGCVDVTHDGKNGLVVETASADSLYNAMVKLYHYNETQRKEMGSYGRKLVLEKYDEKIIVDEYLKLILQLST